MKSIFIVISSGSIISGFSSIIQGASQASKGQGLVKQGEDSYKKAYSDIPEQFSSELLGARELINGKREAYNNGTMSNAVNEALSKNIATSDENAINASGGNTGAVMKAIMGISNAGGDAINKNDEQSSQLGNQLLGLENTDTDEIQKRADAVSKQRADFNVMRGSQYSTLGYGLEKAGQENISSGISSFSSMMGGSGGLQGSSGSGGSSSTGGGFGALIGGMIGG